MANAQRPVVNQRLYFCKLHLDWLAQQLANQDIPKSVLEQSLGESILFHLINSYQAYLAEIAIAYNLPPADFINADTLIEALKQGGFYSAEANELRELELADSWLSRLIREYQAVGPIYRAGKSSNNSQIVAFSSQDNSGTMDLDVLKQCWQQLSGVIENQRARLEEW
ncbi:DUF6586 family protein [Oceanicoccus sagamiensis]|uniref:Uncharacterized protein n=1 Tax=Oceanicoccus sagamiensis TaxID=716816 RepID=A0A1X9NDN5_9GAMM|nr:DUF6586 family protein [Oceanicoccus sagamiensis]ARN75676.1 hypothetical protein BST96_17125 [Oceanicoccus sagamiensis]